MATNNALNSPIAKGTHSTQWSGIWASSQNGDIPYTLNGDVVMLNIPTVSATANSSSVITNITALPASLRPSSNRNGMYSIANNSINGIGTFTVNTSGTITFFNGASYANFSGSGTSGMFAGQISYKL